MPSRWLSGLWYRLGMAIKCDQLPSRHLESVSSAGLRADPRPEFFRLPIRGRDPYYGLTRSFYYEGEKRGYWRLVRLRDRGRQRGVTLVPFDAVAAFVRAQQEGAE